MSDFQSPPDPQGSPLEKLVVQHRFPDRREFSRYLLAQGVDPDTAEKFGRAVDEWERDKDFDKQSFIQELELWSNIHTHDFLIGSGPHLVIAAILIKNMDTNELDSIDPLDGSVITSYPVGGVDYLSQDEQTNFYIAFSGGSVAKYDETVTPVWTVDLTGEPEYQQAMRHIVSTPSGSHVAFCSQENMGVCDSDGNLLWFIDLDTYLTTASTGVSVAVSPDETTALLCTWHTLVAFDINDGTILWEQSVSSSSSTNPQEIVVPPSSDVLYLGKGEGIQKRDITDGSLIWNRNKTGFIVYVKMTSDTDLWGYHDGSSPTHIIKFDTDDGTELFSIETTVDSTNISDRHRYGELFIGDSKIYLMGTDPSNFGPNEYCRIDIISETEDWVQENDRRHLAVLHSYE